MNEHIYYHLLSEGPEFIDEKFPEYFNHIEHYANLPRFVEYCLDRYREDKEKTISKKIIVHAIKYFTNKEKVPHPSESQNLRYFLSTLMNLSISEKGVYDELLKEAVVASLNTQLEKGYPVDSLGDIFCDNKFDISWRDIDKYIADPGCINISPLIWFIEYTKSKGINPIEYVPILTSYFVLSLSISYPGSDEIKKRFCELIETHYTSGIHGNNELSKNIFARILYNVKAYEYNKEEVIGGQILPLLEGNDKFFSLIYRAAIDVGLSKELINEIYSFNAKKLSNEVYADITRLLYSKGYLDTAYLSSAMNMRYCYKFNFEFYQKDDVRHVTISNIDVICLLMPPFNTEEYHDLIDRIASLANVSSLGTIASGIPAVTVDTAREDIIAQVTKALARLARRRDTIRVLNAIGQVKEVKEVEEVAAPEDSYEKNGLTALLTFLQSLLAKPTTEVYLPSGAVASALEDTSADEPTVGAGCGAGGRPRAGK